MVNHYLSFQMVEILEHKYYLSEKAGYDIGLDQTLFDWVESGHAHRFHKTYMAHRDTIDKVCSECNVCSGLYDCRLPNDLVHMLMEDNE